MPVKKRALGRGLDALFGTASAPVLSPKPMDASVRWLAVGLLRTNPFQPRKHFDVEKLEELATSIAERGILQPLIARNTVHGYEIVAGERRWRAAQKIGLAEIPVIVRD